MVYSGAWEKLIHEKNQKSKISWHCPFKLFPHTFTRFVWVSAKFGTCTVVSVNGTLVEAKMCIITLESTHFIFNKCPIYTHDGASAKPTHTKRITVEFSWTLKALVFLPALRAAHRGEQKHQQVVLAGSCLRWLSAGRPETKRVIRLIKYVFLTIIATGINQNYCWFLNLQMLLSSMPFAICHLGLCENILKK
jgi:hypothetical protein